MKALLVLMSSFMGPERQQLHHGSENLSVSPLADAATIWRSRASCDVVIRLWS